jgi:hypothetical protein
MSHQQMRRAGLGNYGDQFPYSEREVFRGQPGGGVAHAPVIITRNRNSYNLLPFAYQLTDGSKQLLPANEARVFLFIQNQSLADTMYFNFGNEAGVNLGIELYPAQGFVFNEAVPWNAITVIVNSATAQRGIIVEGAIQL